MAHRLLWLFALSLTAPLALIGCAPAPTPPSATSDPLALVTEAAANIRSTDTFRMTIAQTGPDYRINTVNGIATFRQAQGQYVAPNMIQAQVRVIALGIPLNIDIFARSTDQWYRAVFTGNNWLNAPFAVGFNPESLIAEDTGFNAALNALTELNYVGIETLETGVSAHHLSGIATGEGMNALLVGIMEATGEVPVDVYIDQATMQPVRFVLEMFEREGSRGGFVGADPLNPDMTTEPSAEATAEATTEQTEPYIWIIDIYDINAAPELDPPAFAPEATPEATTQAGTS